MKRLVIIMITYIVLDSCGRNKTAEGNERVNAGNVCTLTVAHLHIDVSAPHLHIFSSKATDR